MNRSRKHSIRITRHRAPSFKKLIFQIFAAALAYVLWTTSVHAQSNRTLKSPAKTGIWKVGKRRLVPRYIASPFANGSAPVVAYTKKSLKQIPVFREPNLKTTIGYLPGGKKITILDRVQFSIGGQAWYVIEFERNRGYIRVENIKTKFFNFRSELRLQNLDKRTRARRVAQNHFIMHVAPVLTNAKWQEDWHRCKQKYIVDKEGRRIYIVPGLWNDYQLLLPSFFRQAGFIQEYTKF